MAVPLPDSDGDLVRLAVGGSQDAFSALYARYFPGIYDFLARLLRDRDEAADVTQDTFVKAMEQLSTLDRPDRFKSWLFSIAHRNGLNRIRSTKRTVPAGAGVDDDERATMAIADPDPSADPEQAAEAQEVADIVWEAAAGLDARTYTVMDLHVRQGLDSAEIAEILGVSRGNAYTMVSRMKQAFSNTLATYLLVRKGREDCADLAAIVAADIEMTPEVRKTADRHVRACEVCSDNRTLYVEPVKIFAALLLVPVPAGLQAGIWGTVAAGAAGTGAAVAGAGAESASGSSAAGGSGGGGASGLGAAAAGGTLGVGVGAAAVSAALAIILAVGGWLVITSQGQDPPREPVAATAPTGRLPTVTAAPETAAPTTTTAAPLDEIPEVVAVAAPPATIAPPPPPRLLLADDRVTMEEDGVVTIDVLANDSGDRIQPPSVEVAAAPAHGSAVAAATGLITYRPDPDYFGNDSFAYSATDRHGSVASAVVTVTIMGVDDPPVFPADFVLVVDEDGTVRFDPLAIAHDPDGDALEIVAYDATSDAGGTIVAGSLIYTPPADFNGRDRFTFTIGDGTTSVLVPLDVIVEEVPDPPRPPDGAVTLVTDEDSAVDGDLLAGWHHPDGAPMATVPGTVSSAAGGRAIIAADGAVTYGPAADFNGADRFTYEVTDGDRATVAEARVTVRPVNDPPVLGDARLAIGEDASVGAVVGAVPATDVDGDPITFAGAAGPFEVGPVGEIVVVDALDHETEPMVAVEVAVTDGNGGKATGTVVVVVEDVNEAPTLDDVELVMPADAGVGYVVGAIVGTDPDAGDELSYTIVDGDGEGTFALSADGVLTVVALPDPFPERVSLTVVVSDRAGLTATATVTVLAADDEGPAITAFAASPLAMYTSIGPGLECPFGPSSTTVTATVTDPSAVVSVVLRYLLVFDGSEVPGRVILELVGDEIAATLTVVEKDYPQLIHAALHLTITAEDGRGNVSTVDGPSVRVRRCDRRV